MSKLLIYLPGGVKFDVPHLVAAISSIDGVSACRSGDFIGAVFECIYKSRPPAREAIVRISKGDDTVTVDGVASDAFQFALALQSRFQTSLWVTDMDYQFNLEIGKHASVGELIAAARHG